MRSLAIQNRNSCIQEADTLLKKLFPICRSITGNGVRETFDILRDIADFSVTEVRSGTTCYDWTVPREWNIRDAYIADENGKRIIDFQKSNIHIVGYSAPVDATMTFKELEPHLHTLPKLPDAIPYRTAYYKETWGFCLTQKQYESLDKKATYHVHIDAEFSKGSLTYGDVVLPGTSGKEFVLSTYCCHPSLANDSLSGVVLWTLLLKELKARKNLRHSYRFVIAPETIGVIAYLSKNEKAMKKVEGGFVITTVAGPGPVGYKESFAGNYIVDRAARNALSELGIPYESYPFDFGSDERQYAMPAFRIPTVTLSKDKYYEYEQYHTSLDNLDFVSAENLVSMLELYLHTIELLEMERTYTSLMPYCEPMLGKRGLYPDIGGANKQRPADSVIHSEDIDAMRWIMMYSDGETSLFDIAEKTGFPVRQLHRLSELLCTHSLLKRASK